MPLKKFRHSLVLLAAAILLTGAACNKARSDAQVASEVQNKINADQAIQNKQIAVLAAKGVVTLSGQVGSDSERNAAAGDAASIQGVRTVVNNLSVQPADNSMAQAQPSENQPPAPAAPSAPEPKHKPRAGRQADDSQPAPPMNQAAAMQPAVPPPPPQAAANVPPPPPPPPQQVTISSGTTLSVRMLDSLSSESNNGGDTFRATLNAPVVVDGKVVIPTDADLYGRVVSAQAGGRFKGSALLTLELNKVSFNGHTYVIQSDQWSKQTQGRGKGTAEKVGGGAALGALIGALAGGGKGAAIGTAVGAGAGGTAQGVSKQSEIKLGPESLLNFHLNQPVTVEPSSRNDRNAGRQKLE